MTRIFRVSQTRWRIIVSGLIVGLVGGVLFAFLPTRQYSATTTLYVATQGAADTSTAAYQGSLLSQQRVKTYTDLVTTSPRITSAVIGQLGLQYTEGQLREKLNATASPNSTVFSISATDTSPTLAANIANSAGQAMQGLIAELERPTFPGQPPAVAARTVDLATPSDYPVAPNRSLNLILGILLGSLLGFGCALARDALDTRIRDFDSLEKLAQASSLTVVPPNKNEPVLLDFERRSGPEGEPFRRLRTNLDYLDVDSKCRTIAIASALPGEGKTTAACNLALALADAGRDVVLVDGDLRRPRVHRYLSLEGSVGLSSVLAGRVDVPGAIQSVRYSRLKVITSGAIPPNPSELVGSVRMNEVLSDLQQSFEYILLDSAPLLPVSDGAILASKSDGALLVCEFSVTRTGQVASAVESLVAVNARVLGTMFSRYVSRRRESGYGYYEREESPASNTLDHRSSPGRDVGSAGTRQPSPRPR